jgi:alpha-L-fucosidase 2
VTGLRARGGLEVGISWRDGTLASATVRALVGQTIRLRYGTATRTVNLAAGQTYSW